MTAARKAISGKTGTRGMSMRHDSGEILRATEEEMAVRRLAAIVESSDDAIISKELDGIVTSWNEAAERLFGYSAGEMIGRSITTIIPDDRLDEEIGIIDRIRRGERVDHFETVRRRKDGSLIDISLTVSPICLTDGRIVGASKIARDISERRQIEEKLARQALRLKQLNRAATIVSRDLDLDRIVQSVTDVATGLIGARFGAFFYNVLDAEGESYLLYSLSGAPRDAFERFGMPRNTRVFDPTFRGEGIIRSDDIRADPRYGHNAPHHGMPEGHLPVVSYLAVPVVSASGKVHGGLFFGHDAPGVFDEEAEALVAGIAAHAAVAMDNARLHEAARVELAQRSRAEEALGLMLGELRHRVKNTLAMVQAIASQTFRSAPVSEREAFEARVRALADAHDLLTEKNWGAVSVGEVIERALHLFTKIRPGRITVAGTDTEFPASKALLVAMVLHELGTNAVKYGALSNESGRVEVGWEIVTDGDADFLLLGWTESGGPRVEPPSRSGFGSRMVERALRSQRGDARIDFDPAGVRCTIKVPA